MKTIWTSCLKRAYALVIVATVTVFLYYISIKDRKVESFRAVFPPTPSGCTGLWKALEKLRDGAIAKRDEEFQKPDSASRFSGKESFDPYEKVWDCHIEQRVGKLFGDGGKFVCGVDQYFRSRSCLVYSVGSAGDFSFEIDVIKKFGCEVHTFDPTGNADAWGKLANEQGIHFHPWGLQGGADTTESKPIPVGPNSYLSLDRIASELGHLNRRIDILKVDCEGCEYGAFPQIWADVASGRFSIGQVQIELHGPEYAKLKSFFSDASAAGFDVFHKERNHWGCNGWTCVEFSLIHRQTAWDIYKFSHCQSHYNTTK